MEAEKAPPADVVAQVPPPGVAVLAGVLAGEPEGHEAAPARSAALQNSDLRRACALRRLPEGSSAVSGGSMEVRTDSRRPAAVAAASPPRALLRGCRGWMRANADDGSSPHRSATCGRESVTDVPDGITASRELEGICRKEVEDLRRGTWELPSDSAPGTVAEELRKLRMVDRRRRDTDLRRSATGEGGAAAGQMGKG